MFQEVIEVQWFVSSLNVSYKGSWQTSTYISFYKYLFYIFK